MLAAGNVKRERRPGKPPNGDRVAALRHGKASSYLRAKKCDAREGIGEALGSIRTEHTRAGKALAFTTEQVGKKDKEKVSEQRLLTKATRSKMAEAKA